ncbi:venom allergen-1-like [Haematobia irritans]|uniref:Putative scp-like extracellular protein n=1 Tax=Haematobia irritans TaxID=7368 RepID=A0A1L8ECG8_HAEIR
MFKPLLILLLAISINDSVLAATKTYSRFLISTVNPCTYCSNHIACRSTWRFSEQCLPNVEFVEMTPELRNYLLDLHNERRNIIAGGMEKGFDPAVRMATMSWNYEFEYLSKLNLLQCVTKHDKCRRTPDYPYVGQNLASVRWTNYNFTLDYVLEMLVDYWYRENQYITKYDVKYMKKRTDLPHKIGHFTLMAQERANEVGCAISRQSTANVSEVFLACDYSFTSFYNVSVYREGSPASQCQSGQNPKYPNLCSVQEVYNIKDIEYENNLFNFIF